MLKTPMALALCGALTLTGCANMTETQSTTAKGAGVGAVAGGVLGAVTGGRGGAARGAAIGAGVGALGGYVWSKRMEDQKRAMEQSTQGTGVTVSQTADNRLRLDVPSDISFAVGSATIQPNFRPVLDSFARNLQQYPGTTITIVGHTDDTGPDAANERLSLARAASVRDYLSTRGVDPQRVRIEGHGEREPVAANTTEQGRAMNRRVEVYVAESPQHASGPSQ